MRIDAHQHFWKFNPSRDTWIDDSMLVLQNNFLPKDLKPLLSTSNFDGCIAVEAHQSEEQTQFLLDLADENSFIKGVVGWVDLLDANVEKSLVKFSKHPKFKGVRHVVQAEPDGFMLQDDFLNGIAQLEKFNLTYDILIFPHQLKEAIELVQHFPNQKFVIDHLAKPYIKSKKIDQWKADISKLASYQNVFCKVSGLVTEADWSNWVKADFTKYLDTIFEAFSTNRLLYGSDWPVCLLAANYTKAVNLVENYIKNLPQKEQATIMGNNAAKFYNIN